MVKGREPAAPCFARLSRVRELTNVRRHWTRDPYVRSGRCLTNPRGSLRRRRTVSSDGHFGIALRHVHELVLPMLRKRIAFQHRVTVASVLASILGISGCDSSAYVAPDPFAPDPTSDSTAVVLDVTRPCPQTYEFGNYGCARAVIFLSPPVEPLPELYRLHLRAQWADSPSTTAALASPSGQNPKLIPILLTITVWDPRSVSAPDTASVWITARILEDVRPIVVNVPLPIFAADSTLRSLYFAAVGSVPRPDTVRFSLKRR